jgi:hypothetical protein
VCYQASCLCLKFHHHVWTIKSSSAKAGKAHVDQCGKHSNRPYTLAGETTSLIHTITGSLQVQKALHTVWMIQNEYQTYSEKYPSNSISYEQFQEISGTKFNISFEYLCTDMWSHHPVMKKLTSFKRKWLLGQRCSCINWNQKHFIERRGLLGKKSRSQIYVTLLQWI